MGLIIFYFLVGAVILLLLWTAIRAYAHTEPKQVMAVLKVVAAIVGVALGVWLIVSGRLVQALMLGAMLAPLFMRWKSILARIGNLRGPTRGQKSDIATAYLRMTLDHDTGTLDGVVVQGGFRGRRLGELSPEDLMALLAEIRINDTEGATLLEAYLDRVHSGWRSFAGAEHAAGAGERAGSTPSAAMTREEAFRILGLAPGADDKAIREAHRRLMLKLHPDQGGSTYLAAKINQAKDLLLGD
jgi:hypothetical protein